MSWSVSTWWSCGWPWAFHPLLEFSEIICLFHSSSGLEETDLGTEGWSQEQDPQWTVSADSGASGKSSISLLKPFIFQVFTAKCVRCLLVTPPQLQLFLWKRDLGSLFNFKISCLHGDHFSCREESNLYLVQSKVRPWHKISYWKVLGEEKKQSKYYLNFHRKFQNLFTTKFCIFMAFSRASRHCREHENRHSDTRQRHPTLWNR